MSLNHSPAIVTDGLVLCLDAANVRSYPKSGTTWSDLVGGNDGAMQNMTASNFSSANGGILSFDGTDEHVNCGNLETLNNICIQMNVRVLSNPGGYRGFCGARASGGNDHYTGFNIDMQSASTTAFTSCSFESSIRSVPGGTNMMSSSVDFGTWCNICITTTNSDITMYLNGIKENTVTRTNNYGSTIAMTDLQVGRRPYQGGSHNMRVNADFSSFCIYNRGLTADEVRQNYEATVGRYT